MKQHKKQKIKQRSHYMLFNSELPFGHQVERDRTKYTRKAKHRNNDN